MLIVTMVTTMKKLATSPVAADSPLADEQDDDQRIAEAGEELQPERRALDGRRVVGSVGRQPRLCLRGIKADGGRRQPPEKLFDKGPFQTSSALSSRFAAPTEPSQCGLLISPRATSALMVFVSF